MDNNGGVGGVGGVGGQKQNGNSQVISGLNKQKVAELESQMENEKTDIKIKAEMERKKIEEQKNLAEDQKIKLLKALEE